MTSPGHLDPARSSQASRGVSSMVLRLVIFPCEQQLKRPGLGYQSTHTHTHTHTHGGNLHFCGAGCTVRWHTEICSGSGLTAGQVSFEVQIVRLGF